MAKAKKTCSKGHELLKGAVICIRCQRLESDKKRK